MYKNILTPPKNLKPRKGRKERNMKNTHMNKALSMALALLMLVSAFYDKEKMMSAYNTAVSEKYRFFSFGDAMVIL